MHAVAIIARLTLHTVGFACGVVGAAVIVTQAEQRIARNRAAARRLAAMGGMRRIS